MAVLAPPVQVVASGAPPFVQVTALAPPFVVTTGPAPPITIVASGAPPITLFNDDGSIWSAHTPAGGEVLLTGETDGFAADFTHPVDAERVAVKVAGTVVSSGLSFFTNSGTSSKWVFDAAGTLVNVAAGSLAIDYHPSTHAALGLLSEPPATNLLLNNATLSTQSVTVTAVAYTLSFFGTGTITLTGVSTAGPLVGTGASNRVSLTFTPTAGSLTCPVSGTVSNAQLETGSVASSIIPTLGASVTRASDKIKITPASINHSSTAGSWWVDVSFKVWVGSRLISYFSGIAPIYPYDATTFALYDGTFLSKAVPSTVGSHKVAIAFASADRAITADGLTVAVDTTAGVPFGTPGASIGIGHEVAGTALQINGYIRKLYYLPRRMTNPQLVTATT